MKKIASPLAHLDLSVIADLFDAEMCPDDIAQHLTGMLQISMPVGVTVEAWSIDGYEASVHLRDGMTGTEVTEEVWLGDMEVVPAEMVRLLADLQSAAASADTGLTHVPFATRSTKRNAHAILVALKTRLGAGVDYLGTKKGVAIYRLPDAFVGAPIFGIDMAAAHTWARLFDAQLDGIPGAR
ncbi:hypothetical protein [Cryobacterium gelidum]|uniref:Uncharacterized protein n=1 Tax=Cryobacterium gelidum TaxID=1259164 RepID=A0A4R9AR06_9MICO|nr:hypothetical protein [Cryobacterium gelidum]TFD68187.1 hypothetical protein E3T50_13485 [Cryobacterium gelidum]